MKAKYIPNILSCIRLILVGVFIYAYYYVSVYHALGIFIIAGATDVLDGILARKFNWITNVGKILDPIADKSMQITVLLCMTIGSSPLLPWWVAAFFVIKEGLMAMGALFIFKKRDTVVSSRWFGKLAVCIFYVAIFVIIVVRPQNEVVVALCLITIISALASFITYTKNYMKQTSAKKEQVSADI